MVANREKTKLEIQKNAYKATKDIQWLATISPSTFMYIRGFIDGQEKALLDSVDTVAEFTDRTVAALEEYAAEAEKLKVLLNEVLFAEAKSNE